MTLSKDLKKFGVVSKPLFTKAEKRRLVLEAASFFLMVAAILVMFSLLALCNNTPEPIGTKKAGKECVVWTS